MNWTEILRRGGVPEPPGFVEAVKAVSERPKKKKGKGKKKKA